jgi:hypothetical protein
VVWKFVGTNDYAQDEVSPPSIVYLNFLSVKKPIQQMPLIAAQS